MLVTLREILKKQRSVAAFNVFGYEDAISVIHAAEELNVPVVLMTNKDCVEFIPHEVIGPMLVILARAAKVPVCVHLDHSRSVESVERAIASGYTSVMFDGSQLPVKENLAITKQIVALAHAKDVSVEAEIGSVGYSDPNMVAKTEYTDPDQAAWFAQETGVDALAVAIGTVHRMRAQEARIDFDLLARIKQKVSTPLVIHGSSGVKDEDLAQMCQMGVAKINIGTSLRMAFGNTLRETVNEMTDEFDRLKFFPASMKAVAEKAKEKMMIVR